MTTASEAVDTTAVPAFGRGPLSRASAFVYTLLVTESLFLVAASPGLAGLVLLERHAGNLPLAALCLLPAGPAFSAVLYAVRHRGRDLTDLRPAAAFWRGYRVNARGVLKLWVPWLAWMAVLGTTFANFAAAGVPGWWAVLSVLVVTAAVLWMANAVVIMSLFDFRARDVSRLAAYFLTRSPGAAIGNAGLLVAAVALTLVATEAATALLVPVFAAVLLSNGRTMIAEIRDRFTAA
ncbi:DUF624 domain-containing protein [Sphaerisporangium rubeum]|uniref:DUF624 domain-containing protein n=1 Tax=Sphaerisporangium rubeum TaxID=321317 RepID=A0A7X0ICX9_9ACTN|nr:DUF624 domain-containing protein [Sphaerisporangium rubeum]MBB6472846.1 hypothetical protein [Sphaerisporangium rubeum]